MSDPTIAGVRRRATAQLTVGGVPLDRLAERVGATPFFAYDRALLTERSRCCGPRCPTASTLSYAVKANPMPAVVQHLSGLVDSLRRRLGGGDARRAGHRRCRPTRVSFAGPGKTARRARRRRSPPASRSRWSPRPRPSACVAIGERLGIRPRVAVRVNPDFAGQGLGHAAWAAARSSSASTPSGCRPCSRSCAQRDVEFLGFHIFAGSQNLNAEILCEAQRKTVELALRLADDVADRRSRYLNLGGGFGIPYFEKDEPLDLAADRARTWRELLADAIRPRAARGAGRRSSSAATSSARPASTSPGSSTARSRAARPSWSSTAACTTSSPPRATSAR